MRSTARRTPAAAAFRSRVCKNRANVAELDGESIYAAIMLEIDEPATLAITRASANPENLRALVSRAISPSVSSAPHCRR
jgi:hypothetical protein